MYSDDDDDNNYNSNNKLSILKTLAGL